MQERRAIPDRTVPLIIAGTVLSLALVGAFTTLILTGHDASATHFAALIGTAILNLAAVFGVGLKLRNTSSQIASVTRIAADTNSKTSDTHEAITNGLIADKLDEYLEARGLEIKPKA